MSLNVSHEKFTRSVPTKERPISESYRLVARQWCDADAAASLREELKTTTLEQLKTKLINQMGEMPDNRAERKVKASPEWSQYITEMCEARSKANLLRCQLEYLKMKFSESISRDANDRHEYRLGRGS